jgi:hypothetical protein
MIKFEVVVFFLKSNVFMVFLLIKSESFLMLLTLVKQNHYIVKVCHH